jgi:hypothetical protein
MGLAYRAGPGCSSIRGKHISSYRVLDMSGLLTGLLTSDELHPL